MTRRKKENRKAIYGRRKSDYGIAQIFKAIIAIEKIIDTM